MNAPLLIPSGILYPIALFGLVFSIITVSFSIENSWLPAEAGNILTYLAMLCSFVTAAVLIIDVFKNNLSARYLWTLAFLLTGCIGGLYYLMKRANIR